MSDALSIQQLFHMFCDSSMQPKLLLSTDHRVLAVSSAFAETFGVGEETAVGRQLFEIESISWDSRVVLELLRDAAAPGALVEACETSVHRHGGSVRYVRCSATILSGLEVDSALVLSVEDCTPLQMASEMLRERDDRMRSILDGAVDAIVMIDSQGRIKSFNPAAERLFGYRRDEVLGENVKSLMPAPYSDEHDTYLAHYLKTGKRKVIGIGREVVGLRKDGTEFPMELSVSEIRYGQSRHFMGTVRELTSTKRSEEALRASEERVRAILDTAVDAIVTINSKGVIKSLNPAAQTMFGYTYEEAIGENVSTLMPAPFREQHDSYLQNYLRTGERKVIGIGREATGMRKDGSTFPMELSVSEVVLDNEKSFTGIVRDVTARKRSEERLRAYTSDVEEARARLEQQAAQLQAQADTLRETQQLAEVASKSKSEFLANMSHEIRTPITAILGFTDQLADRLQSDEDVDAIETIRRNGLHLIQVINDILDLSKVEAGRIEVCKQPVALLSLVDDVVALMKVRADEKSLGLITTADGALPDWVLSDAVRLRQILVNLIGNAIKFTDSGEVRVVARFCPGGDARGRLEIDITDTGIGMDSSQLKSLFQPFTQVDESNSRRLSGAGLGLAISQRLAGLLGGEIEAVSQKGVGSRFRVKLDTEVVGEPPSNPPDLQRQQRATAQPNPKGTGRRILVAEDGPDNQRLFRYLLTKFGYDVTLVENGREAIEAIEGAADSEAPFSLVLMDMQMPVLDGCDATRELREKGYRLPIIAATAHAMDGARDACLESGCDDYLCKPFSQDDLRALLEDYLDAGVGAPKRPPSHTAPLAADPGTVPREVV